MLGIATLQISPSVSKENLAYFSVVFISLILDETVTRARMQAAMTDFPAALAAVITLAVQDLSPQAQAMDS